MTDLVTRLRTAAHNSYRFTEDDPEAVMLCQAAAEIERLRLGLEIIASDPHPCIHAIQSTAQRYLDGGEP